MSEQMERKFGLAARWLRGIAYIAIASIVNSGLSLIPVVPAGLTTWCSRGITAAMIFCTWQLAPVSKYYKKSAFCRTLMLAATLVTAFLRTTSIPTLLASGFSILAVYQEYGGHGELTAERDAVLAAKWHSLFFWGFAAGVLIFFGTMVSVFVLAMMDIDAASATAIILLLLNIPQLAVDVVYLRYLQKTISLCVRASGPSAVIG